MPKRLGTAVFNVSCPDLSPISFPFIQGASTDTFYMAAIMLALGLQSIIRPQIVHRVVEETAKQTTVTH